MRSLIGRLGSLGLMALLIASCQRNLIYLSTPTVSSGATSSAAERTATIQKLSGSVETRTSANANWAPAVQGQVLAEGTQVRTGAGARAVIGLTEGSHIYLGANSQFTLTLLNRFLDSQLTTLDLKQGQVWVLLNGGALDVQTPYGIASARNAYLSVEQPANSRSLNVTCLQGVCGFGSILIPSGYKLTNAADNQTPEQMQMADFGVWGLAVPEATQLAYLSTEAVAQGSATMPVVATGTASPTQPPTDTPPPTGTATSAPSAAPTDTLAPNTPSATVEPPTATREPSSTPFPSPTQPKFQATVTPPPFTPLPAAPVMGHHSVRSGETIYCIGRGYGVLPVAIAQANGLSYPSYFVATNQNLAIPEVQWFSIPDGPVCATQFTSLYPGLSVASPTPAASRTPAGPALTVTLDYRCTSNCGSRDGVYSLHVDVIASGGVPPYTYDPAKSYDLFNLPHCKTGEGTASVTSSDGQTAQATWKYEDVSCR